MEQLVQYAEEEEGTSQAEARIAAVAEEEQTGKPPVVVGTVEAEAAVGIEAEAVVEIEVEAAVETVVGAMSEQAREQEEAAEEHHAMLEVEVEAEHHQCEEQA